MHYISCHTPWPFLLERKAMFPQRRWNLSANYSSWQMTWMCRQSMPDSWDYNIKTEYSANEPNKNSLARTRLFIKTSFDGNLQLFSECLCVSIAASIGMLMQSVSHFVRAPCLLGMFLIFPLFFMNVLLPLSSMETDIPHDQLTSGMTEEESRGESSTWQIGNQTNLILKQFIMFIY